MRAPGRFRTIWLSCIMLMTYTGGRMGTWWSGVKSTTWQWTFGLSFGYMLLFNGLMWLSERFGNWLAIALDQMAHATGFERIISLAIIGFLAWYFWDKKPFLVAVVWGTAIHMLVRILGEEGIINVDVGKWYLAIPREQILHLSAQAAHYLGHAVQGVLA